MALLSAAGSLWMKSRFTPPGDLNAYDAYIFDCDGTLAETMGPGFLAWRAALKEGGAAFEFTWDLFMSRAGMSMTQTVVELSKQFGVELDPERIVANHHRLFKSLAGTIRPVREVLDFARKVTLSHPVAVASGSSHASVARTLRDIGAEDLFPVVVTPEDVALGKPHPDMFLLAAKKLGVEASRCLVLEDAELGFEAARRAQMDYVVVGSVPPTIEEEAT